MICYTKDLAITAMESHKEQYFKEKIERLLCCYNKDSLIEQSRDNELFLCMFTNSLLSEEELYFILLKRYYLATTKDTPYIHNFNLLLNECYFDEIEEQIKTNPNVRALLIANYISNINKPNHYLAMNKAYTSSYDKVNSLLLSMKDFYTEQLSDNYPQLKKEFL